MADTEGQMPELFKSPDSSNVYAIIGVGANGTPVEMAVSAVATEGNLYLRFIALCEDMPKLKHFTPRGAKKFVGVPNGKARMGVSLDKVQVMVFGLTSSKAKPTGMQVVEAIDADDGWKKLGEWVSQNLIAEGMDILFGIPEVLRALVVEASTPDKVLTAQIKYPSGLLEVKKAAPPKAQAKAHVPEGDGDFEDEGEDE
jgi:hypothetical protein